MKGKCDNCGDENTDIKMRCDFCDEQFCAECASFHRDWCKANDEWEFL